MLSHIKRWFAAQFHHIKLWGDYMAAQKRNHVVPTKFRYNGRELTGVVKKYADGVWTVVDANFKSLQLRSSEVVSIGG